MIEEMAVKTMVASEVPRAECMMILGFTPCPSRTITITGTIRAPPPMPSRPAIMPATPPMTTSIRISMEIRSSEYSVAV